MLKTSDRVLKCLIPVRLDGVTMDQILDAVQDEESYLVVLQWGQAEQGIRPRKYVAINAREFRVITNLDCEHELECTSVTIDLDNATTFDLKDDSGKSFKLPPPR